MTVFFGILFSSIREIEVLYVFNWEHGTAQHEMQGNRALSCGERDEFSRVAAGTWCIFSSYGGDGHLKLGFVQRRQDSCLNMTDTSGKYTMLGRKIQTLLKVSPEAKLPLLVGKVILVFLSIFTNSQASSPFEALNSAHLSKCQMDVRPSVQKRLRTMAFLQSPQGIQTSIHLVR